MPKQNAEYINNFMKSNYDSIRIILPKGSRKIIKSAADRLGISVNAWISRAISDALTASGQTLPASKTATAASDPSSRPATAKTAPAAAEATAEAPDDQTQL